MTAANDNTLTRFIAARIVSLTITVVWTGSVVFALAAAQGLFR